MPDQSPTDAARPAQAPADHIAVTRPKIGVLLANLGTPDATDYWSMRRYLNEFLSDKRVVDYPSWKWQPILQGIILNVRPNKSGAAYKTVWNTELDESPLLTITRAQSEKMAAGLAARYGDQIVSDFCMRYGNPSTDAAIRRLQAKGCDRIVFFPLYPQYAAPSSATANDQAFRTLMKMNWQPAIRTVPAYFEHPAYLEALANSVEQAYGALENRPDHLVLSYHGVPERYLLEGDPYHCQCLKTSRLLAEKLGWDADHFVTTFQSKFGREKWIGPATVDEVARLAREGKPRIAIISPAFAADCLETLEEISVEIRDSFIAAGGKEFTYIPCLNDRDDHIEALLQVLDSELAGWVK